VLDKIVAGFSPEEVEQLGDNIVQILGAVKHATQPKMLAIADEAASALESYDENEPMNWRGMLRASRDEDVQRGIAVAFAVLRRIGRLSANAGQSCRGKRAKLEKLLGPSVARAKPKMLPPPAPAAEPPPVIAPPLFQLEGFDKEGFWRDASTWTPDLAQEIATSLGYCKLSDAHWLVIEFARKEYAETKKSPNVRRLATVLGGSIKDLYALFPNTPGKSAARIAGLPKPAGCI
jgi:tRNA 2-thiouridine synthesizing protein E